MTLLEKKQKLVDGLSLIEDPQERFSYVIDKGKKHPGLEDDYKTEAFRIEGCMSNLWLVPEYNDGLCTFRSDADSLISKGIAALLCDLYSSCPPDEILTLDPGFLRDVGITQHLSPNRQNGLANVYQRIRGYAELCLNPNGQTEAP